MTTKLPLAFSGTYLTKTISYDSLKVKDINSLKKLIALELKIKENSFSFDEQNPQEKFKKLKYGDALKIKLNYLPKDVSYQLQYLAKDSSKKKIIIPDGYKMDNKQVIDFFNKQGIFFSNSCLAKAINFDLNKINLDEKCFDVDVKEKSKIITLNVDKYYFSFEDSEPVLSADKVIITALQKNKIVNQNTKIYITKLPGNVIPDQSERLSSKTQYNFFCNTKFNFTSEQNKIVPIDNNAFITVLDAKKFLAKIFTENEYSPEDIIIKHNDKEITASDNKKRLIDFGWQFYFIINKKDSNIKSRDIKLSLDIEFVSEESSQIKFKPFTQSFHVDESIKSVANFIKNKFNVDDKKKIDIKYNDGKIKFTIDVEMTLEDNLEEMKQKDGKYGEKNVLYVEIKDKPPKKTKKIKPKILSANEEPSKPPQKQQTQQKKPQKPVKATKVTYTFEFDDREEEIELQSDSLLKDQEKRIKELFELDKAIDIEFSCNDKVLDTDKPLNSICESKNIHVSLKVVPNVYLFQTNRMSSIGRIELDPEATVRDFKIAIARDNDVDNLADIKILFAGKDLLDDIVMANMNISNTILFIYIRNTDDILLMTAKALRINKDEIDSDDDDDDE